MAATHGNLPHAALSFGEAQRDIAITDIFSCTEIHTVPNEVACPTAADLAAAQRYDEAMKSGDMAAARTAMDEWMKATDALTDYLAKHPHLYRGTG